MGCGWKVNLVFKTFEVLFWSLSNVCYLEGNLEPKWDSFHSVIKCFAILFLFAFMCGLFWGYAQNLTWRLKISLSLISFLLEFSHSSIFHWGKNCSASFFQGNKGEQSSASHLCICSDWRGKDRADSLLQDMSRWLVSSPSPYGIRNDVPTWLQDRDERQVSINSYCDEGSHINLSLQGRDRRQGFVQMALYSIRGESLATFQYSVHLR